MQKTIRIGTRKSKLALVQTHMVEKMILEAFPDLKIEICEMSTKGDELLDRSLLSFGGKGVFTQELEAALLQGQIDLAVHSAKDMPMEFPEGLGIGAVLRRGPVEDVIVTKDGTLLKDLKPGSVVGTGSLRRELQIKKINPLIRVKLIRGNVQTRLRKLEEGQYDAIVLAAAGLTRLELSDENQWKFEHLSSEVCLPAAGQAAGIEWLSSSILAKESTAWFGIVIVGAWQAIAMNTIIYISGLQTVPEDVYEAGAIDGATGWRRFKDLTFPLIIPFFTINMVLCMKNFLMVFDQIMALTKGGPSQSTESISYLIYQNGMSGGQFGFQSANAVLFFVVIVAISAFQMTVMGKKEEQL